MGAAALTLHYPEAGAVRFHPERRAADRPGGAFPAGGGGTSGRAAGAHPLVSGGWSGHDHVDWSARGATPGRAGQESDVAGTASAPWASRDAPASAPSPRDCVQLWDGRRLDCTFSEVSALVAQAPEGGPGLVSILHHLKARLGARPAAAGDPAQAEPSGPTLVARLSGPTQPTPTPGVAGAAARMNPAQVSEGSPSLPSTPTVTSHPPGHRSSLWPMMVVELYYFPFSLLWGPWGRSLLDQHPEPRSDIIWVCCRCGRPME